MDDIKKESSETARSSIGQAMVNRFQPIFGMAENQYRGICGNEEKWKDDATFMGTIEQWTKQVMWGRGYG